MTKPSTAILFTLAMLGYSASSAADEPDEKTEVNKEGRVHITWLNYDNFRDIRPSNQSRHRFRKRVFSELDRELESLSKDLPQGHILVIKVTNMDLAGEVFPNSFGGAGLRLGLGMGLSGGFGNAVANDVRLVERVHFPSMEFSYTLLDENQQLVKQATDIRITDLNFLDRTSVRSAGRQFAYEKRMLRDWYRDAIHPLYPKELANNQ